MEGDLPSIAERTAGIIGRTTGSLGPLSRWIKGGSYLILCSSLVPDLVGSVFARQEEDRYISRTCFDWHWQGCKLKVMPS